MAQSGGGKIKIINWERFNKNWSQKTIGADQKYKQDLSQSMTEMQKIMQTAGIGETEKAQKVQSLVKSMKEKGTFQHLPEGFKRDVSDLFKDEEKEKTVDETKAKKAERPQAQDTNQSVDAGPAKVPVLNPTRSTSSPSQSRKQHGGEESQDTKALNKQIEQLKTQLADEKKMAEKRKTELEEQHKEFEMKEKEIAEFTKRIDELKKVRNKLEPEVRDKQQTINTMEKQLEDSYGEQFKLQEQLKRQINEFEGIKKKLKETEEDKLKLSKEKKQLEKKLEVHIAQMYEAMADEKRKHDSEMQKLTKDRDDMRDRFSKLAGAKLSDQNADIADLSDPNRAMKLSERFGQLYDDEWTNAFETLTEKKMGLSLKEAIAFLLRLLQDCWSFCNTLLTTQMESLHNVFLHPSQNMAKIDPRKNVGGLKDRPKIGSKEDKTLRELRRTIGVGPSVIEEAKQCFLLETKSWSKEKTGYDKKHIDACAPYIQKCAEVCWLMAVHDPPLYMKMDVKPGEKLDPNVYSVYSLSGNTIDFLVWPPLLNGKDGGLLAKGVAEPQKIVGRKK